MTTNRYPWDQNTTPNTADQDDPRYETPGGAANKIEQALEDAKEYTDAELITYVAQTANLADDSVTRPKIAPGAVGAVELDPSLLDYTTDIAVAAKFNEVDAQLADTTKVANQEDFITTLQRHMTYKGQFNILPNNVTDSYNVSVLYDIGNGKAVSYTFFKQLGIDDFLMLGIGRYGNLTTNQNLFAQRNFDSKTGTWVEATTYYTTQVGATMTISFYGSQLVFHHHVDDRGGYWRFIVDGDTANPIDISTWAAAAGDTDSTVFTKTTNANHTVVATFMGDDPSHVPSGGAGTSRGWANFISGQFTFNTYIYATTNSAIIETMVGGSNKEFAFQIRKHGTADPYYFVPYHTAMTAYKAADPVFLVDGVPTTFTAGLAINGVKDLKVVQSIYGRVPEHVGENLIKISIITTFAGDGTVSWDGKMEVLVGVDVALGYVDMLPINPAFGKKLLTGFENKYPTIVADGSTTILSDEGDLCVSYLALNDSTYKNVGVVMRINNPRQSLRQGQTGRGDTFIHHRVDNNQKFYPQVYSNAYLPAGYIHRFSGGIYIAAFDGLYDLF